MTKGRVALIAEPSAEPSDGARERARERNRAGYRRRREQLLNDPAALQRFRARANERTRRYQERNAEKLGADRRRRANARYSDDAAYRAVIVQKQRWYVAKNREAVYERNREYYNRRREQITAQRKARRQANLDQFRASDRARNRAEYDADPDAVLRYNRDWRRKNPEKARLYVRVSHHKRRAAAGSAHWTREEWLALLERYGGHCHYCGAAGRLEADHRIPLSRGGSNTIENIVPACKSCNCSKNDRTEEEFWEYLAERGRVGRRSA